MHLQAKRLSAVARFLPRRRAFWAALVLSLATAWSAPAKPPEEPDAKKPTGIPYEGLSGKELKALVGARVDIVPRTGKTFRDAELVQVTPGKQPGTLRSIDFKPADGGSKRNLQAKSVSRLVAGLRVYEVMPDRRQKSAFLLVDTQSRDALVNAKLKLTEDRRYALWPKLTAEVQEKALEKNKAFLKKVDDVIPERKFQLHETPLFLFYTDVPVASLTPAIANLDHMYRTLSQKLGIAEGTNIWQGKAIILIFSNWDHFARFEKTVMENTVSEYFMSIHHTMWDGDVITASAIGDDPDEFSRLLIQNVARSYMFRYRSNVYPPDWVAEGIAFWVAANVTDGKSLRDRQVRDADAVRIKGRLGGFFDEEHMNEGWHWGVAASIVELMLKNDAQAFRQFVLGLKEGQTWQESLQDSYGLSPADLAQLYGEHIGVPNLKP